jgi:hypothetical protein
VGKLPGGIEIFPTLHQGIPSLVAQIEDVNQKRIYAFQEGKQGTKVNS